MHKIGRNDACWCGSGIKYKNCHEAFDNKLNLMRRSGAVIPPHKLIKTPAQVDAIRRSAKINIEVLNYVAEHIRAGITTEEIDRWVYEQTTKYHAIPATLNFEGYPKSVCTSINETVCHGIPSPDTVLKDGDIVNVDCSTILDGYFSDSSRMFCIGDVSLEKKRLVKVTEQSLQVGLSQVKPWGLLGDVGQAINEFAKLNGYSVVREIGGHGIGLDFHEEPWVSFVSKRGTGMVMAPGLMFTIEPMINMGTCHIHVDKKDGWTVRTADGKPSAQWEIQVLVTEKGYEIIAY